MSHKGLKISIILALVFGLGFITWVMAEQRVDYQIEEQLEVGAVSYTHLTLPTICSV